MFTSICQKKLSNPAIPTFENRQIEVSRRHKQLHRGFILDLGQYCIMIHSHYDVVTVSILHI